MIGTRHEANNQTSHPLQVLTVTVLSRTGWEGSWPCQAKGRTSIDPLPNNKTILPGVSGFCLQKKEQTAGLFQGCVTPRNRMHRPGPYLVMQTSCHGSYHASPEHRLSSQRFSPHPFLEEQFPKVCPSAPTQMSLPSPPNQ